MSKIQSMEVRNFIGSRSLAVNQFGTGSDPSLLAWSTVSMVVTVRRGEQTVFHRDFLSENDRIRPTQRVRGLGFSSDHRLLYVPVGDELSAWEMESGEQVWGYVPPRSWAFLIVSPVCLAVGHGLVASAFDNGSIAVWTEDGVLQQKWNDNDAPRMCFLTSDPDVLLGSDSFSLCTWQISQHRKTWRTKLRDRAYGMDFSAEQNLIAVRGLLSIQVFRVGKSKPEHEFQTGRGLPLVAMHPHRPLVATSDVGGVTVCQVDGALVLRVPLASAPVALKFSQSGDELWIGCVDGTISAHREF